MKKALVTGCCGQDGSYISEHLVNAGYSVVGVTRPSGERRLQNLKSILDAEDRARKLQFRLHYGDITDPHLIVRLAQERFDEIYLLAGVTHVLQSFMDPTYTMRANAESPIAFFDAVQRYSPQSRIYFAGSSEMFGGVQEGSKANEEHPFEAHSPYAVAKVAAFHAARLYRKLGLFVVGGIGFNHESYRRGENFVTRKLGLGLKAFKRTGRPVALGRPDTKRDWHHARDTMRGAWLSLQQKVPREYVFASGIARSVRELAQDLCDLHDVPFEKAVTFNDEGEQRPWDIDYLCGDRTRAVVELGWRLETTYRDLLIDVSREPEA